MVNNTVFVTDGRTDSQTDRHAMTANTALA